MKESEAKTKYCPFIRVGANGGYAKCKGSACMMWEDWTPPAKYDDQQGCAVKFKSFDDAETFMKRHFAPGQYKSVRIHDGKGVGRPNEEWELHRVSDESEGDCGLKVKEPGCFYPG